MDVDMDISMDMVMEKDKEIKQIILVVFTLIYIIITILFMVNKEISYVAESIAIYSAYLFYINLEKKGKLFIRWSIVVLGLITAVIHSFLGHYMKLYDTSPYFDKLLHMFGIFAFSLAAYSIIAGSPNIRCNSKLWVFIIVVLCGIAIGAIFEIVEFTLDVVLKTQSQKGLLDTNLDLVSDVIGAIAAGLFAANSRMFNKSKQNTG